MSFIPTLSAVQWALLAAIPPAILALYFLKLRRTKVQVSSTLLWRKTIEDLHVNSLWQRLRQSLLLWLQLLAVLLAALALLRPGWRGTQLEGNRFIFLVDNSASMNAVDAARSRLDEAKQKANVLIDQMQSGDVAMLVSFSRGAKVEHIFSDNRRELRRRLDAIEPSFQSTSLNEALRVASGLANPGRAAFENTDDKVAEALPATLYILSDGKFPDVQGFALGALTPVYVPIGAAESPNLGITAFDTQAVLSEAPVVDGVEQATGLGDRYQAFVRVDNLSTDDQSVKVRLEADGKLVDAQEVTIKALASGGVAFDLAQKGDAALKATISPGGKLASDDVAWLALSAPRLAKVLVVTPGNDALRIALATDRALDLADIAIAGPDVLATPEHAQQAASGTYDLIVYDQCVPKAMPACNTLFIGRVPPFAPWGDGKTEPKKISGPQIIDVDTSHPMMQLIDLSNVSFAESLAVPNIAGAKPLIDTADGPIFTVAVRDQFEDAVLGAEIVGQNAAGEKYANTDWPLRVSFPTFVLNALEYLGRVGEANAVSQLAPGELIALKSTTSANELAVETPGGKSVKVARNQAGTFNFADTHQPGIYRVLEGGKQTQAFAVNLFDAAESDIRPRGENSIRIGYNEVKGLARGKITRKELWPWLLLGVLGVLGLEWFVYNRRVYL